MVAHVSPAKPHPRSRIDCPSEGVRDGVEIRRDIETVEFGVISGVDDRRYLVRCNDPEETA